MSNNKQSMKLYTERQMKEMFRMGLAHSTNEDAALYQFAPIELPSDEEIYERAFQQWGDYSKTSHQNAYSEGAKWMRDKIQGGNNEQNDRLKSLNWWNELTPIEQYDIVCKHGNNDDYEIVKKLTLRIPILYKIASKDKIQGGNK